MREWAVVLGLWGCASAPSVPPVCVGAPLYERKAADDARQFQRDGVAFAIPAVALLAAGMIAGAADISQAPNDPTWLRGTTIGLLGAGVLTSVVAFTFDVLARQARERSVQRCVQLSDAKHR